MVTSNQKPIIDTHTKREKNSNMTLKIVVKSQKNKRRKGKKDLQNQIQNN